MMSQAWFHDFTNREDVQKSIYCLNPPDAFIYEIYKNKKIDVCSYGSMRFELIGGLFFLKSYYFLNHDLNYESYGDEAN